VETHELDAIKSLAVEAIVAHDRSTTAEGDLAKIVSADVVLALVDELFWLRKRNDWLNKELKACAQCH